MSTQYSIPVSSRTIHALVTWAETRSLVKQSVNNNIIFIEIPKDQWPPKQFSLQDVEGLEKSTYFEKQEDQYEIKIPVTIGQKRGVQ